MGGPHAAQPGRWADRQRRRTDESRNTKIGYTIGMKTAVSIPDEVFERVERLARRARKSRSEVFSAALKEYVARHEPDEITDAFNDVCARIGEEGSDAFVAAAARRILEKTEW
jgi:predicted DNA-binding protein